MATATATAPNPFALPKRRFLAWEKEGELARERMRKRIKDAWSQALDRIESMPLRRRRAARRSPTPNMEVWHWELLVEEAWEHAHDAMHLMLAALKKAGVCPGKCTKFQGDFYDLLTRYDDLTW